MLLVMVNTAFPYKEGDAAAMMTALNVLQTMADRGNSYIRACHGLLTKIRGHIKPAQPRNANSDSSTQEEEEAQKPLASEDVTMFPQLLPDENQPLNLDFTGDPVLWAEVLDSMNIDMDRQWVETAFRRGQHLDMPGDM